MNLKSKQHLSDTEIIHNIILGEVALYELLIRRYNPFLYKTARSYGYIHEDAEDLMQETYIQAYTNLSKFENRASFKTWIIKIMLNNCFHKKQKFGMKNEIATDMSMYENSVPMYTNNHQTDTNKMILNKELNRIIENSLQKAPIEYRMVFTLREINGLNVIETAEMLDITESNVKVRLNRVKTMLRTEIEKMYSAEDLYEFNLIYCDLIVDRVMREIKHSFNP